MGPAADVPGDPQVVVGRRVLPALKTGHVYM